jgi:hypothetical protein
MSWNRTLFIMDYAIAVMTDMDQRVDPSQLCELVREIAHELEYEKAGYPADMRGWEYELAKHIRSRCLYELK